MTLFRRILVPLAANASDAGLRCYAVMLERVLGGPEIHYLHVADGEVLDSILAAAVEHRSDLILVGHASRRRRRSLARRLATAAPCSVWMVPDGSPAEIRRILIPIDFGARSADTVVVATLIAEAAGLDECLALHVHFNDVVVSFDEFDEMLEEDRFRAFNLFVAPIDLRGVWVKPVFADSSQVADTVLRTALEQQSDLIVMGTRGRSPSAAVLLGSQTEHCMMDTRIPLLAVKHFGARLSLLDALRDDRLRQRGPGHFA